MSVTQSYKKPKIQTVRVEYSVETSEFGARLMQAMAQKKMKASVLARGSGIHRVTVADYCRGKSLPSVAMLASLCMTLRVSPNWLVFGTDEFVA